MGQVGLCPALGAGVAQEGGSGSFEKEEAADPPAQQN